MHSTPYPTPPTYTIDFHLINLVCAEFLISFHYNPLTYHPSIHFSQLSSDNLDTAHTGLFVRAHDTPSLLDEKLASVISTGIRVCLITPTRDTNYNPPLHPSSYPRLTYLDQLYCHT